METQKWEAPVATAAVWMDRREGWNSCVYGDSKLLVKQKTDFFPIGQAKVLTIRILDLQKLNVYIYFWNWIDQDHKIFKLQTELSDDID